VVQIQIGGTDRADIIITIIIKNELIDLIFISVYTIKYIRFMVWSKGDLHLVVLPPNLSYFSFLKSKQTMLNNLDVRMMYE
jgi:hypothetical protein